MKCCAILAILFSLSAWAGPICENDLIQNKIAPSSPDLDSEDFNADGPFRFRAIINGEFTLEKLFAWKKSAEERGVFVDSIAFYGAGHRSLYVFFNLTGNHRRYLEVIKDLGSLRVRWFQKLSPPPAISYEENTEILRKPLLELDLSNRALNCLRRSRMNFVGDVLSRSEDELSQIPGMGVSVIPGLKDALAKLNLRLGTPIDGWPPPDLAHYPLPTLTAPELNRILMQPIESLPLGNRILNQLSKSGVRFIGDLVTIPIRRVCYIGYKSVRRIDSELAKIGLRRDLRINNWPPTAEFPPQTAKASE